MLEQERENRGFRRFLRIYYGVKVEENRQRNFKKEETKINNNTDGGKKEEARTGCEFRHCGEGAFWENPPKVTGKREKKDETLTERVPFASFGNIILPKKVDRDYNHVIG